MNPSEEKQRIRDLMIRSERTERLLHRSTLWLMAFTIVFGLGLSGYFAWEAKAATDQLRAGITSGKVQVIQQNPSKDRVKKRAKKEKPTISRKDSNRITKAALAAHTCPSCDSCCPEAEKAEATPCPECPAAKECPECPAVKPCPECPKAKPCPTVKTSGGCPAGQKCYDPRTTCVVDCASMNNMEQMQTYVKLYEESKAEVASLSSSISRKDREIAALKSELEALKGE